MIVKFNSKSFMKEMENVIKYSVGYLDGVQVGKKEFLRNIGHSTIELLKQYIDTNARVNPAMLHHVYEWEKTGSPSARLFDITYTISNLGLSLRSTFSQSQSIKRGSNVPFYDKARLMESGTPVVIRPKRAQVLAFTDESGNEVFTRGPISVLNPGGDEVEGGFEKTFDNFFNLYFSQVFLNSSGILGYLDSPILYKKNLAAGSRGGKAVGYDTGYRWIASAGKVA
jgi:hypothetical protein